MTLPKIHQPQIVQIAGAILIAVSLLVGVTVFMVMQRHAEELLSKKLQLSLHNRVELTESEIGAGFDSATIASTRPRMIEQLQLLNERADDTAARNKLDEIALSLRQGRLTAIAFYSKDGQEMTRVGVFARAAELAVPLNFPGDVQILWDGQLLLRAVVEIKKEGRVIGKVITEASLPATTDLLKDANRLGASGEQKLCRPFGLEMQCFPTTLTPRVFTVPQRSPDGVPLPMTRAFAGETGFVITQDYRHQEVVAAYAPLGDHGLGMSLEMNTAELYAPVRQQLRVLIPLLAGVIIVALLLLRWRLTPLVLSLVRSEAKAYEESEQRVRALLDNVADGIVSISDTGMIELFNPAAECMFGYRSKEVIGKNISMLMPEPYHSAHDGYLANYLRTGQAHIIGSGREVTGKRRDGSVFPMDLHVAEFSLEGRRQFIGSIRDITERKRAEAELLRFKNVLDDTLDMISMFEPESLRFVYVNQGAILNIGYSREELLGMTPYQIKPLVPEPKFRQLIAPLLSGEQPSLNFETVHRRKNGSDFPVAIFLQLVTQSDGSGLFVSVVRDITEQKNTVTLLLQINEELEQRVELRTALLNKAKEEAEQANLSKSTFLSSMSHELRTPLNAILGYAQLMEMDASLSQEVVENAGEIKRAGEYLLALINDILDLSRIEAGKLELKMASVLLSDVIQNCHAQNIQAAGAHNITLHMTESCAAFHVSADLRGLLQVLNNLVSNAIKYNRAGGQVSVSSSEEVRGKVKISVMDTGIGIAAEKQSQLFQPFNRLGAEMSGIQGTGIGLFISRKLIAGMQGTIGFESVHGLGSTFWVELPIFKNVNAGLLESSTVTPQQGSASRKVPRVLVAEDYAPNQKVLKLQLQTLGYAVDMAANGVAALNLWRKNTYDLILTDIDMPLMNGIDFCRAVRNEERGQGGRIPVLAITAASTVADGKRYQSAGIDEVLSKPLSMDALRAGLTRWLGNISTTPSNRDYPLATETAFVGARPACDSSDFAILDLSYLYRILGQVNLMQARILVASFMSTAAEGLDALDMQMTTAAAVAKEMHKQKSSAKTVGALRYANLAVTLEQQTKDAHFTGIAAALGKLREALAEVVAASTKLLETPRPHAVEPTQAANLAQVVCHVALIVDDNLVVLQQVKAMLDALGVGEVVTAINGVEATRVLAARGDAIELLVCDLSMPEMDGVELIRGLGKTGFKGGLILISGVDDKIISTVNKLAVLHGLRVLGQLQKPVIAAQLAILLAHTADLPVPERQMLPGPLVSSEAIRAAMDANEFSIWFQPKVDAGSLKVVGMEALARWQLADGKFIPPDNFISVAEREGLIGELSRLLVSLALSEAAKLFSSGFPLKIAINISGAWLNDLSLPDFVLAKTKLAGLCAEDVIFEVTETGVMEDLTTALDVLSRLRLKGFGLSIDDFGIGYSSFEQLVRLPFTEMKLDRSFICKGIEDAAARAILESSMDMAHKLNLLTVAEGVETELELKLVRSLACDLLQGYLIAKPMPVKDMLVWLENEKLKKRT